MRGVEAPFTDGIEAEKNRFIEAVAASLPASRTIEERLYHEHAAAMMDLVERYVSVSIRVGLWESVRILSRHGEKATWEQLWFFLVRQWVSNHAAQSARETAETTRSDLQRIIDQALAPDEEFNPVAVAEKLLKVRNLSRWRAETIARTEVHAAMMYGSEEGAAKVSRDEGVTMLKKWLAVSDERTRVSHAGMNSHAAIPLDADFNVGGALMKRPGDPRGGAANCINCRCVLTYKVEE